MVDKRRDFFDDTITLLLKRDLGNDDFLATFLRFYDFRFRANTNRTTTSVVALANRAAAADNSTRREVGAFDDLEQVVHRAVRLVNKFRHRITNFDEVVRRNRSRHTDGDSVRAVDQQVRKLRWQYRRFRIAFVIGWNKVNGICLLYTSPSPRDQRGSRMPSSA